LMAAAAAHSLLMTLRHHLKGGVVVQKKIHDYHRSSCEWRLLTIFGVPA